MATSAAKLAVDTGGTFTDLILLNAEGDISVTKTPSTPPQYATGIVTGIRSLLPNLRGVVAFLHGTTVATNAIVQKRGAKCGLICTSGFRDLLDIKRGNRPGEGMLNAHWFPPEPLIKRRNRLPVAERIDYRGRVLTPLDEPGVQAIVGTFKQRGIDAIAICFLNSYINPIHEQRTKEIVQQEFPEAYVSTSSELIPVMREFERTSTTCANTYVGPLMRNYLSALQRGCQELEFGGDLLVMQSHGGVASADFAQQAPIRTVMSGPVAGVLAAKAIAENVGVDHLVSFDMGGTSTDVSLVYGGEITTTEESSVEFGVPVLFPSLLIESIGAGGGSIAWLDAFGNLKSGPQSAGAEPGPACYGRGGHEPTVTDAQLLLGRIDPAMFLAGKMQIQPDLAESALRRLASAFGRTSLETAAGVITVTESNMERALRKVSIERGFDPREFTLVAFGGAGPLHCLSLAQHLEMREVIVPPLPGLTSALGLLYADIKHDYVRSYNRPQASVDFEEVEQIVAGAEGEIRHKLKREGFTPERTMSSRYLRMRYAGGFEPYSLLVSIAPTTFSQHVLDAAIQQFTMAHEREFRYSLPDHPVVVEMIGVEGLGMVMKPPFKRVQHNGQSTEAARGRRNVYFEDSGYVPTTIYERARLSPGAEIGGPAVIEQMDSTTLLPPDATAQIDEFLNLRVSLRER